MGRLSDAWRLLNLPCEGMSRLASESLDRPLGPAERLALQSHGLYCGPCRRYLRQIRIIRLALARLASGPIADDLLPGPPLSEEARERIKRRIDEGRTGSAGRESSAGDADEWK